MKFSIKYILLFACVLFVGASCKKTSDAGVFTSKDGANTWEKKVYVGQEKKKVLTISGIDVEELVFDPTNTSTIYLASKANGVYKTENGGDQWRGLNMGGGRITDIAIDPNNNQVLYALRGSTILQSMNAGENWETIYTDTQQATMARITVDRSNSDRIFASTSIGTLLFSDDAGQTWKVIYQVDEPIINLSMSPTDSKIMYIVELEAGIHKTTDGGLTWENLFENEEFKTFKEENKEKGRLDEVMQIQLDPQNHDIVYMVSRAGLLKSIDGGKHWEFIQTLISYGVEQNRDIKNLTIYPNDFNTMLFTVGKLIHKTNDGGTTWYTIETFPSAGKITSIIIDPNNTEVLYAGVQKVETKKNSPFIPSK